VPAAEASGTITSIGAGVENLKPGDAVMLFLGPDAGSGGGVVESAGALAEYVTVDAAHVALAPKKLYLPDAAGIPLAGLTGLQALDTLDVQEGERVLVSGAMSALGLVLVQLAKHRGAEVYAAVESAREEKDAEVQHALFTALGATVVDTPLAAWAAEHGKFDKAVDVAGKPDIFGALNPAAHVIAVGSPAATVADSAAGTGAGLKRMGTHLPWSRSMAAHARSAQVRYEHHLGRPDAAQLSKLAELVDKGELHVVMDSTFEVADFALAFLRLESGLAKGRVLVEFTRL
jgi:alcohol dehydrogenase